jgi:hypothetical protein
MGSEDLVERSEDMGGGSDKRVWERDLKIQKICEKDRREIVEAWLKSCWITALLAQVLLGVTLSNIDMKAVISHIHLINWQCVGGIMDCKLLRTCCRKRMVCAGGLPYIEPASRTSHMRVLVTCTTSFFFLPQQR